MRGRYYGQQITMNKLIRPRVIWGIRNTLDRKYDNRLLQVMRYANANNSN